MLVTRRRLLAVGLANLAVGLAACGGLPTSSKPSSTKTETTPAVSARAATTPGGEKTATGPMNLYAGRNQTLIEPLVKEFMTQKDIKVEVRYGKDAELVKVINSAENTADVYFAHDAGPLGAVNAKGLLAPLPREMQVMVSEQFRAPNGGWVGVSGRARVIVYNPKQTPEADLPDTMAGLTSDKWKQGVAWQPTESSFQDFVTAMRVIDGQEGAKKWLTDMKKNEPAAVKSSNDGIIMVGEGKLKAALVNHYYVFQVLAEKGQDFPVKMYHPRKGGAGSLVNITGVGLLKNSTRVESVHAFVNFLLSQVGQFFFTGRTNEYAMTGGIKMQHLASLSEINPPSINLNQLADLEGTQVLLREVGLIS